MPKIKIVSIPSYVDKNNKEELIKRILDKNEYIKSVADKDGETFEFIFSYSHQNHKTIIFINIMRFLSTVLTIALRKIE